MTYDPALGERYYAVQKGGLVKSPPFVFDGEACEWAIAYMREHDAPGTWLILRSSPHNVAPFRVTHKLWGRRHRLERSGWRFRLDDLEYPYRADAENTSMGVRRARRARRTAPV